MILNSYPVITDRLLKTGLVGCGRIAKNHFTSILQYPDDLKLVAVCDNDAEALEKAKFEYKVNDYRKISDMLSNEDLDLIVLCTPSGLHPQQAILAAQHGVHVVSEKPMATRYAEGVKMIEACDAAGVRLFIVKQNRHNSTLQLLKQAVDERRFGDIKMVHLNVFWTRPQEYYDTGKGWRGTWEFDGGAFMNQASHYADLVEWLIGPVERVQAMMSTTREIEAEDTGVVNIKWRNGALGSMAVTMLAYPQNLEGSITILGETGSAKVGGVAVNEIETWKFKEPRDYDKDVMAASYETTSVYGLGHPLYYKNVIDVMRGNAEPETDGRAGLKSLEFLTAIYLAARDGGSVGLPLRF